MRVHQHSLVFSSLDNPECVIDRVRSLVDTVESWGAREWGSFGAPPLSFATSVEGPNVLLLKFYPTERQLWEDGALEIRLDSKRLVWTAMGKRRAKNEKIIFQMFLEECLKGSLSTQCVLQPGIHTFLLSRTTARREAAVHAAV